MARISSSRLDGVVALTLVSMFTGATMVAADVRVMKSDEPTILKGAVLKDDAIFDVPAKKTVKVLMPGNVTKVITGPYKGTAAAYQPALTSAKPEGTFSPGVTLGSPPPRH